MLGIANGTMDVKFEVRDVACIEANVQFDRVTAFDAIHDRAKPAGVLSSIRAALRRGGAFLMQDIKCHSEHHQHTEMPSAPPLHTISAMHDGLAGRGWSRTRRHVGT